MKKLLIAGTLIAVVFIFSACNRIQYEEYIPEIAVLPPVYETAVTALPYAAPEPEPTPEPESLPDYDDSLLPLTELWTGEIRKESGIASARHGISFAVKDDGSLWGWGFNEDGRLGDGTTENRHYPVHIMDDVLMVATAGFATFVIRTDGSLWGWDTDTTMESRVGFADAGYSLTPVYIMSDVKYVSLNSHVMAITNDETLWGWGTNRIGQLGIGNTEYGYYPVRIMSNVAAVSAGYAYTMAITTDGVLYGWGNNRNGQLGIGFGGSALYPVRVMDYVIQVSTGVTGLMSVNATHTMAIRADNSLWGWGCARNGQLGSRTNRTTVYPIRIMDDVESVAVGRSSTFVILPDDSLWGFGLETSTSEPVWLMDNVNAVATGLTVTYSWNEYHHTLVATNDGVLWAWGSNQFGQLGDGTTEFRETPVRIVDGVMTIQR